MIGDFHFNGHKLLPRSIRTALPRSPSTASTLANVRPRQQARSAIREMIEAACRYGQAGAHRCELGSLDTDLLTRLDGRETPRAPSR